MRWVSGPWGATLTDRLSSPLGLHLYQSQEVESMEVLNKSIGSTGSTRRERAVVKEELRERRRGWELGGEGFAIGSNPMELIYWN